MPWRPSALARAPKSFPRWPFVLVWCLCLAAGLGTLVGLAYLVGHGAPFGLRRPLEGLAAASVKPVPATVLAVLGAAGTAWAVRRLTLEHQAWWPGPIRVVAFTNDDAPATDADALCLQFRRRLGELRLQAPTSLPGAVPQTDFLDVLAGSGGLDGRNMLGSVLNLLRAALPTGAYEVVGALLTREGPSGCGVTVQVTRLPRSTRPPTTVWATSWDLAIRQAADAATQSILPGTRLCRDQWAAWRRYAMPDGLLHAYEHGAALEADRRYDEALDAYFAALRHDPMNLQLRLQAGKLQEKLGLYLDAFATYEGILMVTRPGGKRTPRRRYRRTARRKRRHTILVARYRRIVLMGGADLARQWRQRATTAEPTRRDLRRDALRSGLSDSMTALLEAADAQHPADRSRWAAATTPWTLVTQSHQPRRGKRPVAELLADSADPRLALELRELLALAALDAAGAIKRATLLYDRFATLDAASVALTRVCIGQRLGRIQAQLGVAGLKTWPPQPDDLVKQVRWIERWAHHIRPFRTWHEHYNAACVFAMPLLHETGDRVRLDATNREVLAQSAIAHLERATAWADNAYVATRRDWLISEDPDFSGLRTELAFKRFEARYFPSKGPAVVRPAQVQALESSRHVQELLIATAARWQRVWARRGQTLGRRPDVPEVLEWWRTEHAAWDLVRDVAVDLRDWETRLRLVEGMRGWGETYGFAPVEVRSPRYETRPVTPSARPPKDAGAAAVEPTVDDLCGEEVRRADGRLVALAQQLGDPDPSSASRVLLRDIERGQGRLRQIGLDRANPGRYYLAALCDEHASLWQLLREWLESQRGDVAGEGPSGRFADQVVQVRAMWDSTYDWWRTSSVVRELVRHPLPLPRGRRPGLTAHTALRGLVEERFGRHDGPEG